MTEPDLPPVPPVCPMWTDGHLCDRKEGHCDSCVCGCGHRFRNALLGRNARTLTLTFPIAGDGLADDVLAEIVRRRWGGDRG